MEHYRNDTKGEKSIPRFKKRKINSDDEERNIIVTTSIEENSDLLHKMSPSEDNTDNEKLLTNCEIRQKKEKNTGKKEIFKKKRQRKKDVVERNFVCNLCSKSYLSYPALYTHKRNKHNIIPITGKPEIFRTGGATNTVNKFKYNNIDSGTNLKAITESIIEEFTRISYKVYNNPDSIFYDPKFNIEEDCFIKLLNAYQVSNLDQVTIPKPNDKNKTTINNILVVYLILLIEVTRDDFFFEIIIYFVFLLRKYLDLFGWDYIYFLKDYGLYRTLPVQGEYCQQMNCEDLPEHVNDFLCIFLEIDESVKGPYTKKDLSDITQNFCYWLYINDYTCYKLCKL